MKIHNHFNAESLEEQLKLLQTLSLQKPLTIGRIICILSGKGSVFLLILLSLPFCQPLQIPGLSTPFGLVIAFLGLRLAFKRRLWLPKKVLEKEISSETIKKLVDKCLWLIGKIKPWIHPRLIWFCQHHSMHILNGLMIALLGIILALPLPLPLSNFGIAWSIVLIALGILENDGLFVIFGYTIFIVYLAVILTLIFSYKFFS